MSLLDDFANSLSREVMVEMAEGFFGARASLDDEKDHFTAKAEILKKVGWTALARANVLHALLLDGEAAVDFYKAIEVVPKRLFALVDPSSARLFISAPRAFTSAKKYERLLLKIYSEVQDAFDEYRHGRYYTDSHGRKRLSLHFDLMEDWRQHINQRVTEVNTSHAPSCVLGFAKRMDIAGLEKQQISEATLDGYSHTLDSDLSMKGISLKDSGLIELPNLPRPDTVKDTVRDFAKDLYAAHGPQLKAIMRRIADRPISLGKTAE